MFESPILAQYEIVVMDMIHGVGQVVCSHEARSIATADACEQAYKAAINDSTATGEQMFPYSVSHAPHIQVGIVDYQSVFTLGLQEACSGELVFGDRKAGASAKPHSASAIFQGNGVVASHVLAKARRRIMAETIRKSPRLRERGL